MQYFFVDKDTVGRSLQYIHGGDHMVSLFNMSTHNTLVFPHFPHVKHIGGMNYLLRFRCL